MCYDSSEEQRNPVVMQEKNRGSPVAHPGGEKDQRGRDNQMEEKSESKCFLIIIISREHRTTPHGPSWL